MTCKKKKFIVKIKFPFYIIFKYNSTINVMSIVAAHISHPIVKTATTTNGYKLIECEDINIYSIANKKNFILDC